jgi:hypothetical protein
VTEPELVQVLPIVISRHDARIIQCTAGPIVVYISTSLGSHCDEHEHGRTREDLPTDNSGLVIAADSFNCDLYSQNAITKSESVANLNVALLPRIANEIQKAKVGAGRFVRQIRRCNDCSQPGCRWGRRYIDIETGTHPQNERHHHYY